MYEPRFCFGVPRVPLYDLADWHNGLAFKNIDFGSGGLPVIKISEIKSGVGPDTARTTGRYSDDVRLRDGDLLFCWSGQPETSIGTYRWFGGEAWLNQHIFRVIPKSGIDGVYLFALLRYLQSNFVQIAANKQTTGLGHVTKADLRGLYVEVPAINEQLRVAETIAPLDDKIELNHRMAETLAAIAQNLFKNWFVDFDPVRAKAVDHSTGLPSDLAALFPSALHESGIPQGWTVGSIEHLVEVNPSTKLPANEPAPYVDMAALPTRAARIRSFIHRPAGSGARFINNDTLIARITPCLENGKTALVDFLGKGQVGWGSTEFIVLRPRNKIPPALPYLVARHEPFRAHLIASMTGSSGRQRVPPAAVTRWEMAIPPVPILEAFGRLVTPLFDRIRSIDEENRRLTALRDSLLLKLISGEIRIAETEQRVVAA
ncbi:restriction endonuclease subunit S [Roseomonas mucosa]|uniref:restriction endonuclease subunit S n=1 Tax=Roseomonas mucosa TaxID=207340 RepID=UPI0028CFA684|nr:restriction endonuclease subunit S [Roseomonas mucosa]MDT8296363.1 restriction endonuclease subunit S [Roseomonas mucosa]